MTNVHTFAFIYESRQIMNFVVSYAAKLRLRLTIIHLLYTLESRGRRAENVRLISYKGATGKGIQQQETKQGSRTLDR